LAVGLLGGDLVLHLLVGRRSGPLRIDQEHAARLEAALLQDALGGHVEHADLRGHDDQIVLGDVVARGPQAVAVQHGADFLAVGEGDGSGPSHGSIRQE
jgi:hypothetical protein